MKDFSPEERLLRLIRSKAKAQDRAPAVSPPEVSAQKPKEEILKDIPIGARPPASPRGEHGAPPQQARRKFSVDIPAFFQWRNLNLILICALLALTAYSARFFLKKPKDIVAELEGKVKVQERGAGQQKIEEVKRPPLEHFSEAIAARNIFSPVLKEETPGPAAAPQGPKLEDIKGQLSLLGVVSGENPQAIIEDKRTQKSYFLNKGGTFDDIEVKDILENKVILIYKGQEFELVL